LNRIPFYAYIRLLFLLYLVLPQTQGARIIYQTHVHPFLEENESAIEDFISSAHERLRAAGIAYLKRAIELLKTNVLGLPPSQPDANAAAAAAAANQGQSYTQTLLARFSLPSARFGGNWNQGGGAAGPAGVGSPDVYGFLSSALSAVTASYTGAGAAPAADQGLGNNHAAAGVNAPGAWTNLIPEYIRGPAARMSFLQAQRERLNILLSALDTEASRLAREEQQQQTRRASGMMDGADTGILFGSSGYGNNGSRQSFSEQSGTSGLSRNRSEADFEKLDAESGAEEDYEYGVDNAAGGIRRRPVATTSQSSSSATATAGGGSWMPWGWRTSATPPAGSSGMEKD